MATTTDPAIPRVTLNGAEYVILPVAQFEQLAGLPPYPPADADGNRPAVEYGRVSIARTIILRRLRAGLSRDQLAKRAKVRVATLTTLEQAAADVSIRVVDRLDAALTAVGA